MDNQTLRAVQLTQLELAKEIKRVCEKLNIQYWMDGGTMLGTVRHHGFIPWDDDLDMAMLRADYERFLREAPAMISDQYFLQTWDTDPGFGLPFAKLRKNGTVFLEEGTENVKMHHGVFVDIFPFDAFPEDEKAIEEQKRKFFNMKRILLAKCGNQPWKTEKNGGKRFVKAVLYGGAKFISLFVSKEKLKRDWMQLATRFNDGPYRFIYPQTGASDFGVVRIPREYVDEGRVTMTFEDDIFIVPKGYDGYLTCLYGDYMTPPPEDQRYNRHHLQEVKL